MRDDLYRQHLADTQSRLADLLASVYPALQFDLRPSPLHDGFRGHARFSVASNGDEVAVTGVDPLAGRNPWESTLWILPGFGQRLAEQVIRTIHRTHSHYPVRGFDVRLGYGTQRAHIVLAVDRNEPTAFRGWAEALVERTPGIVGVSVPSQDLTVGEPLVRHQLLGRTILSHPLAFFQTNYWLTAPLLQHIASSVSRESPASVLDLYCGVGVHSLLAGDDATSTTGIDSDPHAIAIAQRNADAAGRRATYEHASVEARLAGGLGADWDAIVVNPPRSGCSAEVVANIATLAPRCICLICCSAEAQVRDLRRFQSLGYDATGYAAFDMFPFSQFVENVAMLFPR
jgi:tRNA/tmRNA/rRNA uracil-C5-methylase (TrmA/RlmC/RlmD family)